MALGCQPRRLSRRVAQAALLGQCLRTASASFRVFCEPFAYANMDPIVTPKARAHHIHDISGTLGFNGATINPEWMAGNESACDVVGDKSNYWTPSLYRTDLPGPKPVYVPNAHGAYYNFGPALGDLIDPTTVAQPIPLIVGVADGATLEQNQGIVEFFIGVKGKFTRSPVADFPKDAHGVTDLRITYIFPSCWNGEPYLSGKMEVIYPESYNVKCPATHPRKMPPLRLEQSYKINPPASWTNGKHPFFFSSGGANTVHADAVIFWDVKQLKILVDNCDGTKTFDCRKKGHKLGVQYRDFLPMEQIQKMYKVPKFYAPDATVAPPPPTPAPKSTLPPSPAHTGAPTQRPIKPRPT